jgi:AraC-like DNA-binding protein
MQRLISQARVIAGASPSEGRRLPPSGSGKAASRQISAAEVRITTTPNLLTPPPAPQAAYGLLLSLAGRTNWRCWEDGAAAPVASVGEGETLFHDLRRSPRVLVDRPLHLVFVHVPVSALNALAEEAEASWRGHIDYRPGRPVDDPIIAHLCRSMLPALRQPGPGGPFLGQVGRALALHVAESYGGLAKHRWIRGGLAAWQQRRALELLGADLSGRIGLARVARECGLSVGYFARAFRKSLGVSPHRWLMQRRLEAAKVMLRGRDVSLAEVALACGFADQSHFTRAFTGAIGASPGAWRRAAS